MTQMGDDDFYGSIYANVGLVLRDPDGELRAQIQAARRAGQPVYLIKPNESQEVKRSIAR